MVTLMSLSLFPAFCVLLSPGNVNTCQKIVDIVPQKLDLQFHTLITMPSIVSVLSVMS